MRDYSRYKKIQVERQERVLRLTLNNGDQNAFSEEMHTECSQLFSEIRADDQADVVVLTGAGNFFSIAAEMSWYGNISAADWLRLMREAKQIVHDMLALPQPLVIRMNGDAMGLGSSIVSLGDFIVAAEGARIGDHHVQMGLVCGDGGAMTYPFSMGLQRAKEFFLLGREFTAEELYEIGAVTRVAPLDKLDAAVDEVVEKLLRAPREALLWTKTTLNRMVCFSDFIGTDYSLGHEGWTWHLDPAQRFLAEQRENEGKAGPYSMTLRLTPLDCGQIEGTERLAHQYLTGFGEKICSQSILWVVEGGPFPVVIDLPTSRPELVMERFGRRWNQSEAQQPRNAIATLGIDPDEVGAVILSHLHWDHSVGIEDNSFPNAKIYIQLEELRYAAAPYPPHDGLYDPRIIKKLLPVSACDYPNVTVINGDFRLFEGLRILLTPGHTPGLQAVVVSTPEGEIGMASDNIPFHTSCCGRTMRDWIPQGIHVSLDDCYRSVARMMVEADTILPSHDPAVVGGEQAMSAVRAYGTDTGRADG